MLQYSEAVWSQSESILLEGNRLKKIIQKLDKKIKQICVCVRGVNLWNSYDSDLKRCSSHSLFKNMFKTTVLEKYINEEWRRQIMTVLKFLVLLPGLLLWNLNECIFLSKMEVLLLFCFVLLLQALCKWAACGTIFH